MSAVHLPQSPSAPVGGLMLGDLSLYQSKLSVCIGSDASALGVKLISTSGRIPAAMMAS